MAMRNKEEEFLTSLKNYLQAYFTEQAAANEIEDIVLWQDGYTGIISGLTHYPGCVLLIDGRTITGAYTGRYDVLVYVGITSGDPETLEKTGRIWQDILENAIRADWTLGGSCLQVLDGAQIRPGCTGDIYTAGLKFTCEVDCGGFVYEEN